MQRKIEKAEVKKKWQVKGSYGSSWQIKCIWETVDQENREVEMQEERAPRVMLWKLKNNDAGFESES